MERTKNILFIVACVLVILTCLTVFTCVITSEPIRKAIAEWIYPPPEPPPIPDPGW
ncbi:MAG: hypothetical protein Q4C70_05480 [Planctomycetia bacterium]|nr:hypothetical protein [Planctomycetia bacterium]